MTRVILVQDVNGLGSVGDVVEVKAGYSRNYLVPKGMAVRWTEGAQKHIGDISAARRAREAAALQEARDIANTLTKEAVTRELRLAVNAGEDGRLFGSVTAANIAKVLSSASGHKIDRGKIEIDSPIKTLGEHTVKVKLHPNVKVDINVVVYAE